MGIAVRTCKLWSLLVFFLLVLGSIATFASPTQLTYQGRILKTDGTPLEYANVSFIFQITDPAGSCIIYQEQVTGYSMVNSGGVFDVPIGNGTVQFPLSGPSTVLDAFNNSASFNCGVCSSAGGTYSCSTGSSTYTASASDGRKLRVSFYDGSGWKTISPDSVIRSVPFAGYSLSAEKLGTNSASDFLLKTGIPTCPTGTFLAWDGSALSCAGVTGASGGTVTNVTSGNSYITITNPTSTPQLTLQVGTGANTVAAGNDARIVNAIQSGGTASGDLSGTYPGPTVIALQGVGVDSTTPVSNQVLTFNGTKWAPAALPTGNSVTALTGDVTATGPGSAAATVAKLQGSTLTITTPSVGQYLRYNGSAFVNSALQVTDIPALDWSKITTGKPTTLSGYGITDSLVKNGGGVATITAGLDTSKPSSPASGDLFVATDSQKIYRYNGSSWDLISSAGGSGGTITALTSDVSASGSGSVAATVNSVGGSTAATIHTAEVAANAATNSNTASTIVKRDGSGNFAAGAITHSANSGDIYTAGSGSNTVTVQGPSATIGTSYVLRLPTSVATSTGQVLTSDTSGNLSWTSPSTSLPPSGSAGGDLSGTYPNPTLAKISGTALSIASLVSGNFLKYNGTNWINASLSSADLSDASSLIKAGQMPANCAANQTLTFSSPTGTWTCSSIAITGSAFGSQSQNLVLASPDGASGTPTFRALASTDLPSGTLSGAGTVGYVPYYSTTTTLANSPLYATGGNVGIGTTAPAVQLDIAANAASPGIYLDNYSTTSSTNPVLIGRSSRGTTASPSATQTNDKLMFIGGRGDNGSGITSSSMASMMMVAGENWTSTGNGTKTVFYTTPNGTTTAQEVLRLNGNGNIGISSSSPADRLTVVGGSISVSNDFTVGATAIKFYPTDSTSFYSNTADERNLIFTSTGMTADTTFGYKYSWRNADGTSRFDTMTFAKNGNILFSGNVGIGTVTPASKLHIGSAPTATANYPLFALGSGAFDGTTTGYFTGSANGTVIGANTTSGFSGDFLNFQIAGVPKFKVDYAGNITTNGNTTSSGNTTSTGNYSTSGNISTTGAGTVTSAGQMTANSGTASTSPTTGALVVNGGAGVSGALNVGGAITSSGLVSGTGYHASMGVPNNADSSTNGFAFSPDGDTGIFNPGSTAASGVLAFYSNNAETMRVANGLVGINNTAPSVALDVTGAGQFTATTGNTLGVKSNASLTYLNIDNTNTGTAATRYLNNGTAQWIAGNNAGNTNAYTISASSTFGTNDYLAITKSSGNIGIGTTSPGAKLDVEQTQTQTASGGTYGVLSVVNFNPATASSAGVASGKFGTAYNGAVASSSASVYGIQGYAQNNSAYAISKAIGSYGEVDNTSTGSITQAMGTQGIISNATGGTIGTSYELYTQTSNSGTITNQYGLYQSTVSSKNYFAGIVGIGTSSPLYSLDITSGVLTNYVPLALYNSGTAAGLQHSTDLLFDQWDSNTSARSTYGKIRVQKNVGGSSSGFMSFYTNNAGTSTERMRLDSSGNLGLGTTNPTNQFDMQGTIASFSQIRSVANNNGPDIYLNKDRGSVGSPAVIQSADALGSISFRGYDGSAYTRGAYIQAISTAAPAAAGQMTADLKFLTNNGSNDASERMRITAAGNVGIGTTNPVANLHVSASASPIVRVDNTTAGGNAWQLLSNSGDNKDFAMAYISNSGNPYLTFSYDSPVGSASKANILNLNNNGNVGIGTTAPQNALDVRSYMQVKAAASAYDAGIFLKSNGVSTSDTRFLVRLSPDSGKQGQFEILRFDPSTGSELERTTYDNSGNWNFPYCIRYNGGTSGTCASDIRLKKDIRTYNVGLDTLLKITPKNFKYNGLGGIADDGKEQLGVIAQDVEQASPTLVKTRKVKMHPEDKTDTEIKAVDYNAFTYILINSVKEFYAKWFSDSQAVHRDIASLKEENTQIKKENADIKAENAAIKSYLCQKDASAPFCKKH